MNGKILKADFFWPIAGLSFLIIVLLVSGLLSLTRHFDGLARAREQAIVTNGLNGITEEVAHRVVPQVVWDDAVVHLANRFDPDWARENIGQYLHQTSGIDVAFVLDPSNRPQFAARHGFVAPLARYAAFATATSPLVAGVRAKEADRERLMPPSRAHGGDLEPLQASTFALVGEQMYILTATLVQPDFGHAALTGPRAPIVVTALPIEDSFVQLFARRFLLNGLHLHTADSRGEPGEAHVPMVSSSGEYLATIDWRPQTPGADMLRKAGIPAVAILSLLSLAALWLFRRSTRMAQGLIASEARATHLAYFDSLTGLPNRTRFLEKLDHALDRLRRTPESLVAIHCISLDKVREVNDLHGHQAGDELIQQVARRLAAQCRTTDVFARFSSDQFAIVHAADHAGQAANLAARLIEVMGEPFSLSFGRVFVCAAVGIALVRDGEMDPGEAVRQADLALNRAVEDGRNRFSFFEIEMDAAVKSRRALEADLREALEQGNLTMVYQPQVNRRGVMTGVEALVRWDHPVRGSVSPAFFVPVAEECGLIGALGLFTLGRAFEEGSEWPGLKIGVNVSATQLRAPGFVQDVGRLVRDHGIDPRRYDLEITEGVLVGDDPDTHDTLHRLRDLGFSLTLDDFGTGYSSLSYLQRYPIDKIKIDRSFIVNLGVDPEADEVVSAIIKLARALNLAVIAEGVETEVQRDSLNAAGCGDIQGYLFSRPLTADGVTGLLEAAAPARRKRAA